MESNSLIALVMLNKIKNIVTNFISLFYNGMRYDFLVILLFKVIKNCHRRDHICEV